MPSQKKKKKKKKKRKPQARKGVLKQWQKNGFPDVYCGDGQECSLDQGRKRFVCALAAALGTSENPGTGSLRHRWDQCALRRVLKGTLTTVEGVIRGIETWSQRESDRLDATAKGGLDAALAVEEGLLPGTSLVWEYTPKLSRHLMRPGPNDKNPGLHAVWNTVDARKTLRAAAGDVVRFLAAKNASEAERLKKMAAALKTLAAVKRIGRYGKLHILRCFANIEGQVMPGQKFYVMTGGAGWIKYAYITNVLRLTDVAAVRSLLSSYGFHKQAEYISPGVVTRGGGCVCVLDSAVIRCCECGVLVRRSIVMCIVLL